MIEVKVGMSMTSTYIIFQYSDIEIRLKLGWECLWPKYYMSLIHIEILIYWGQGENVFGLNNCMYVCMYILPSDIGHWVEVGMALLYLEYSMGQVAMGCVHPEL